MTSLLIEPLGKNNIQNDSVRIDFLIEQKKKFIFKNKELEIGGDLCTTDRIFLNNRSYIVALNADAMGKVFMNELINIQSPHIKTIRGKGLLVAIVLQHKDPEAAWNLCLAMKDNGLIAKPTQGDKIRFAPPLIINKKQLLEAVVIIKNSLQHLD